MSEAVQIALITGGLTLAGLVVNAVLTYKATLVSKRNELKLARIQARLDVKDEDGATPT